MKSLKPSHFVVLCSFIVLFSCKKEKKYKTDDLVIPVLAPEPVPEPKPEPKQEPEPEPETINNYIPIQFEGSGLSLKLKYKDNTALLTEITNGNENKTVITYTADRLPETLEKFRNGKLYYIVYFEQADKKTTNKVVTYNVNEKNAYSAGISYTLTYNEQQKISSINYFNGKTLIKTSNLWYSSFLNLSEINTIDPAHSTTYNFDQKKGINSNILYSDLFTLETEHWFFFCTVNNVLSIINEKSPIDNVNYSYEYNENGYPSSVLATSGSSKQTIKVTYKLLE